MALLSRLRDLISLSQSIPQYAQADPVTVPIIGPDGQDFSIDTENPDGPVRQIGTKRVLTPLGARLKAGLPDIISSGITAAAHRNVAGGGATDFFGALQDVEAAREHKQQLELAQRRQAQIDAESEGLKRAQADYYRARPGIAAGELGVKQQNADTNVGKLGETTRNDVTKNQLDSQGNVIKGKEAGFDVPAIAPSPVIPTLRGHPAIGLAPPLVGPPVAIAPTPVSGLSAQQQANLDKTGAQTEETQAKTDVIAPKPTKADTLTEEITAKKKIADDQGLTGAERQHFIYGTPMPAANAGNAGTARSDKSYQFNVGELNKIGKPVEDITGRIGRLQDTLAQNSPQADALIGPELLTVMAGGQGSGLRMNEAEIARVIGGRSNWESLKANINKWALDPKAARSITPAQQQQIRTLVGTVANKLRTKQALLNDAHEALLNSDDPAEHRKIVAKARQAFSEVDQPAPSGDGPKATRRFNPVTGKIEEILQ